MENETIQVVECRPAVWEVLSMSFFWVAMPLATIFGLETYPLKTWLIVYGSLIAMEWATRSHFYCPLITLFGLKVHIALNDLNQTFILITDKKSMDCLGTFTAKKLTRRTLIDY